MFVDAYGLPWEIREICREACSVEYPPVALLCICRPDRRWECIISDLKQLNNTHYITFIQMSYINVLKHTHYIIHTFFDILMITDELRSRYRCICHIRLRVLSFSMLQKCCYVNIFSYADFPMNVFAHFDYHVFFFVLHFHAYRRAHFAPSTTPSWLQ